MRQHPGKRIVVTTRIGIYTSVQLGKVPPALEAATINLQSGDYSKVQRREILYQALTDSRLWQREWLRRHEEKILEAL